VVAVASVVPRAQIRGGAWLGAAVVVLVVGTAVRLAVRPIDIQALSAALLGVLLWLGVWLGAQLLLTPRAAFAVGVVAMLLLDVAALPARPLADFDEREALFSTDQTLSVRVPPGQNELVLLVEVASRESRPPFTLAGSVAEQQVRWACPWRAGRQRLVLPVPTGGGVRLRLEGSPGRDGDYLLVYTSSSGQAAASGDAATCSLV
jgi:hypothetical protein